MQVLLVAELEELQSNPDRAARGTVLEASLDKKAGAACSLLVQAGTLRVGDAVQAGSAYGKVGWLLGKGGSGVSSAPGFPRAAGLPWIGGRPCAPRHPCALARDSPHARTCSDACRSAPPLLPSRQVRSMRSPQGEVAEAGPSLAVQMLGLNGVPQAGDEFTVYESEADARVAGDWAQGPAVGCCLGGATLLLQSGCSMHC